MADGNPPAESGPTTADLSRRLEALLAEHAPPPPDRDPAQTPRCPGAGPLAAVGAWCQAATAELFAGPQLTDWGLLTLRLLVPQLLQLHDRMPPGLHAWMQEHLLPCLFGGADGGCAPATLAHPDLVYHLVHFLMQQCAGSPADPAAAGRERAARRRRPPSSSEPAPPPPPPKRPRRALRA